MSRKIHAGITLALLSVSCLAQPSAEVPKTDSAKTETLSEAISYGKIQVICSTDSICRYFININPLYNEGLDTMPQVKFWRVVMNTHPDTGIISTFSNRKIIGFAGFDALMKMKNARADAYRDSIRKALHLDSTEQIVFTKGRKDFYNVKGVIPQIDRSIRIFEQNGVDPFYAQAILLIESPGRLQKSMAGAYGPFQLMRGVALRMGLKVNRYVDERKDLEKSATAASKLLKNVCIPYTNAMLEKRNIAWCETDLWYRLLVLHVYHAGAGNVDKALEAIGPQVGTMDLIKQLWRTSAGAFRTASQNYSQVAIASLLELNDLVRISRVE